MKTENKKILDKAAKDLKTRNYLDIDLPDVVDVISDGEKAFYLMKNGDIEKSVLSEGKTYSPPSLTAMPYLLPDKYLVAKFIEQGVDKNKLYEELLNYHKNISDISDSVYYMLLILWDLHTYFIEKLNFSPIIYLYAVKERGKSRTGKGCIYVARRGLWLETIREADLLRFGNDHKASLGFDAKDFPKKIQRNGCDDLILARFEKGAVASRTMFPKLGKFRDTKYFRLFGPTIVCTNRAVDDIIESRSISINMKPSFRIFNNPVVPEDAIELKAKLTAFRFLHFEDEFVKADRPASGRLGDILSPLQEIVLTYFPERLQEFSRLVKTIAIAKKEDASDAFEAQVVDILIKAEGMVVKGFLSVETITSLFNEGKNEKFVIDVRTIGKICKGLGLSSRVSPDGNKRGIYYDPDLVKNIALQYGILSTNPTVSETSEISNTEPEEAEITESEIETV